MVIRKNSVQCLQLIFIVFISNLRTYNQCTEQKYINLFNIYLDYLLHINSRILGPNFEIIPSISFK